MLTDEDTAKDFGTLVNAPLSKGGHFVFKSEKDWSSIDPSSEYAEFFTLNLNTLSAAIDCIPFNEYVDVDNRYFTSDQLTSIYNNSEEGKVAYKKILDLNARLPTGAFLESEMNENPRTDQSTMSVPTTNADSSLEKSVDNLEDDIEFLLNLTEPVQCNPAVTADVFLIPRNNDFKPKSEILATKSIDLEKWLDSVLDE